MSSPAYHDPFANYRELTLRGMENNLVQTEASAAGTISSVIFVLPGLLMVGYWSGFPFWQTTLLCTAGGILGVIFTVPLRLAMVVHSDLPYPEGVAAAEILKVGCHDPNIENSGAQQGGSGVKEIITGGALAGIVSLCTNGACGRDCHPHRSGADLVRHHSLPSAPPCRSRRIWIWQAMR